MTVVGDSHADHGATFTEYDGRRVVDHYGRPERTHRAVRNVVGVLEMGYGVLTVSGSARREFLESRVTNRVPDEEGQGQYAFVLEDGAIAADLYAYEAGERLLVFTAPGRAPVLAEAWRGPARDAEITVATEEFGVFGVHGPKATEKVASVLNGAASPDDRLSFVRGTMGDAGVTVIRGDGLAGEEGYEVICTDDAAADVFDTLVNRGMNAAPFGYRTWRSLTLEAGTPLFDTELRDLSPAVAGVENAFPDAGIEPDAEHRLVGLTCDTVAPAGSPVYADDERVGRVTRALESPTLETPVAFAVVSPGREVESVRVDGEAYAASRADLPFVEGSDSSARCPRSFERS